MVFSHCKQEIYNLQSLIHEVNKISYTCEGKGRCSVTITILNIVMTEFSLLYTINLNEKDYIKEYLIKKN